MENILIVAALVVMCMLCGFAWLLCTRDICIGPPSALDWFMLYIMRAMMRRR